MLSVCSRNKATNLPALRMQTWLYCRSPRRFLDFDFFERSASTALASLEHTTLPQALKVCFVWGRFRTLLSRFLQVDPKYHGVLKERGAELLSDPRAMVPFWILDLAIQDLEIAQRIVESRLRSQKSMERPRNAHTSMSSWTKSLLSLWLTLQVFCGRMT